MSDPTITFLGSSFVRYGEITTRAGIRCEAALRLLATSGATSVPVEALVAAVWGAGVVVHPDAVRGLVFRVNQLLKRLSHPKRTGLDSGRVVWI